MKKQLLFFDKFSLPSYKDLKQTEGYEVISISKTFNNVNVAATIDHTKQIVDVSALSGILEMQYNAELIFPFFNDECIFIGDIKYKELFIYNLRYCFREFNDIKGFANIEVNQEGHVIEIEKLKKHKRIIDLDNEELINFFSSFEDRIYGHDKFKKEFFNLIRDFRVFNKLGEHKILSLFIMGESGVGKTEIARAIHDCLGGDKKLAKVNFGNYSGDFSLSSLIGSARGYIGSEDGEIFIRVRESDVGILLIDEFEKSNTTLFNYFLDVLETGKMVSSLAAEIDLNGFIIVFTSNINREDFKNRISPELRSRFDYKGHFTSLYDKDKKKFVEFRVNSIFRKFNKKYTQELFEEDKKEIINEINVSNYNNMRDLNKTVKSIFVNFISNLNAKTKGFLSDKRSRKK
ncbi:hypothetical protein BH10BAC5_BH10BAC5_09640 [soil metagenome]